MFFLWNNEEEVYTYSEVVAKLRRKVIDYLEKIVAVLRESGEKILEKPGGSCSATGLIPINGSSFKRIGVVDGGSNIISLNIGYLGLVVAIGIIIEDNNVVNRVVAEPEIIPSDPRELGEYETPELVNSVVEKVREALVFETAYKMLDHELDLLVIDGPLIPYGALGKIVVKSRSEYVALTRYRYNVVELYNRGSKTGIPIIGFVKRPRSKYLARKMGLKEFDHVILSSFLRPGNYYPKPPEMIEAKREYFHTEEIFELVNSIKPYYTYLRLTDTTPPYRVDFLFTKNYEAILSYLYHTRTREGIPYIIMKADEETKITRKLVRELYEDALHNCIVKYLKKKPELLTPLLPEHGGL